MGGGTDQSGVGLTGVPKLTGSPVLLTGPLFPGAGGGMLCALETVTPRPWERGCGCVVLRAGVQLPHPPKGGPPEAEGYSPARLTPESQAGAAAAGLGEVPQPQRPGGERVV